MEDFLTLLFSLIGYQLIGVVLFLSLELAFPRARLALPQRARGMLFLLAVAPVAALVGAVLEAVKQELGIRPLLSFNHGFGAPILASIVLALWIDLQFYTVHRLEHRFFWRFHAVHHSIRNLSAANSYHHWTEPLIGMTVLIPLMVVDVNIAPTLGFLTFVLTYQQFYIHSACQPHFGPFRLLLVDNRYHRIHHSLDPAHHHKNFGAMTPLWDWLFGTLYMPNSNEWPDVGLTEIEEPESLAMWSSLPWRYRKRVSSNGTFRPQVGP